MTKVLNQAAEYRNRREWFLKALPPNSIAIINAADEYIRNGDSHYPYRQNSDFYYLTGFNEPEAVAVLIPGHAEGQFILFNRVRDPEKEVWTGDRAGQEGACSIYGADQSFPIEELDTHILPLLQGHTHLYYAIGKQTAFEQRLLGWVGALQKQVRRGIHAPQTLHNIESIVHQMRLHKSPAELALMRKAIAISVEAHKRAMQVCKPGIYEYELEAEIQAIFTRQGSRSPAYGNIIGTGRNSCVLHYTDNNALIEEGDLVLIDAGAEYEHYAADITRTFPANGHFSGPQRAIYNVVLKAQLAVIDLIKPGVHWNRLQETAARVITEGLLSLGLLQGDLEELIKASAYSRFYMHLSGHWLGMDVHDVGGYRQENGEWRTLEPGMVLTVEPGIYIPEHTEGVDSKWWNIGVRIEDDVLVTQAGSEVLTAALPKTIEMVESLMTQW